MSFVEDMVTAIENAEVKVASSVPDNWLAPVIKQLTDSKSVTHAPAAREEDALGISCGAALSGVRSLCLMQSAGALNTGGTLATLGISYGISVVMVVADRGHLGDVTIAHFEKARAFRPFLEALGIPFYDLDIDFLKKDQVEQAFRMAEIGQKPVALLITRKTLGESS
jgi:sulfopyruvate decarboxylase TPP-binding subunit